MPPDWHAISGRQPSAHGARNGGRPGGSFQSARLAMKIKEGKHENTKCESPKNKSRSGLFRPFLVSRFRVVLEKRPIMRKITVILGIAALLFVTGCPPFQKKSNPDFRAQVPSGTPTAGELVASLNDNARKIQSVGVRYLDIDCAQGAQSVGLRGWMYCQKPKSF